MQAFVESSFKKRLLSEMFEVIGSPLKRKAELPMGVEDLLAQYLPPYSRFEVEDCVSRDGHVFAEIKFGGHDTINAIGPVFIVQRKTELPCVMLPDLEAHIGDSLWHSFVASMRETPFFPYLHKMNEYLVDIPKAMKFLSNLLAATELPLKTKGNMYVIAEPNRIIVFVNDLLMRTEKDGQVVTKHVRSYDRSRAPKGKFQKNRFGLDHIKLTQLNFENALESLKEDAAFVNSVFDILASRDLDADGQ